MWPYKPYTVGQITAEEERIMSVLYCGSLENIHKLTATAGSDNIVGISESLVTLHQDLG